VRHIIGRWEQWQIDANGDLEGIFPKEFSDFRGAPGLAPAVQCDLAQRQDAQFSRRISHQGAQKWVSL
jgi:hypothetical protein